jgi:predicted permease
MLVVAQIALSLLLLVGAGLFAHSLYNLKNLDPGFRTENLMTFMVDPSLNGYSQSRTQALYARLQEDIAAVPGVRSVSMANIAALSNDEDMSTVTVEGHRPKEGEDMNPNVNRLGPGYLATLGIPLIAGREFTKRDVMGAPLVGMINETAARSFFGNQNPIGRHFGFGGRRGIADIEIVGVVKDDKAAGLKEAAPRLVYVPYMQVKSITYMTVYVRTAQAPGQMAATLRRVVQQADANLPVSGMKTMDTQVDEFLFTERLVAMLSAVFGCLATVLAAVGLYGVMAYTVARRTREIGIRVALGASRTEVVRLVMREVGWMAAIGIAIGLPGAIALGRFIQSQLFGLAAYDPFTLALATAALAAAALLAGYIPAARVTRVDPMVALRYE